MTRLAATTGRPSVFATANASSMLRDTGSFPGRRWTTDSSRRVTSIARALITMKGTAFGDERALMMTARLDLEGRTQADTRERL